MDTPDLMVPDEIKAGLGTEILGREVNECLILRSIAKEFIQKLSVEWDSLYQDQIFA